ncbi:MAG: hypothetical protein ACRDRH_08040 [Pseudonocardia sp.]
MDNLGAIVGPLLALGLVALFSVRTAILISVVPGLLAAAAIGYAIRQARLPKIAERKKLRFQVRPVLRGRLGRVLAGFTAFEVGNVAATLLILRATDVLTPDRGRSAPLRAGTARHPRRRALVVSALPLRRPGHHPARADPHHPAQPGRVRRVRTAPARSRPAPRRGQVSRAAWRR